jgi:addiction module HigA family antidote
MKDTEIYKRRRRPTHPGEILREDFLPDHNLSVAQLANAIGVTRQTINERLRERRALSSSLALRLARLFGNSPEFWLNLQRAVDLWEANESVGKEVRRIKVLDSAQHTGGVG